MLGLGWQELVIVSGDHHDHLWCWQTAGGCKIARTGCERIQAGINWCN